VPVNLAGAIRRGQPHFHPLYEYDPAALPYG